MRSIARRESNERSMRLTKSQARLPARILTSVKLQRKILCRRRQKALECCGAP